MIILACIESEMSFTSIGIVFFFLPLSNVVIFYAPDGKSCCITHSLTQREENQKIEKQKTERRTNAICVVFRFSISPSHYHPITLMSFIYSSTYFMFHKILITSAWKYYSTRERAWILNGNTQLVNEVDGNVGLAGGYSTIGKCHGIKMFQVMFR